MIDDITRNINSHKPHHRVRLTAKGTFMSGSTLMSP